MRIRHRSLRSQGPTLQMTAMIDIVFLLLVFFIMTFKVVVPEGDFNLKMPVEKQGISEIAHNSLPPIHVRLRADANGSIAGIQMNEVGLGADFDALRDRILSLIGQERGPGSIAEMAEVEIDCDYGLRYDYVISAMTAISGYRTSDGTVVKLIEKIKFTPPRAPSA